MVHGTVSLSYYRSSVQRCIAVRGIYAVQRSLYNANRNVKHLYFQYPATQIFFAQAI